MINVGKRIKTLRENAGISALSLSKMAKLDPSQISKIERGGAKPSLDSLERICHSLNISLSDFFADEDVSLPLEQQQLLEATNFLSIEQMKLLKQFLVSFKNNGK